ARDRAEEDLHRAQHDLEAKGKSVLGVLEALIPGHLEAPARRLVACARALAQAHRAVLDAVRQYQQEIAWVAGDARKEWLTQFWPRLDEPAIRRRCAFSLKPGASLETAPV